MHHLRVAEQLIKRVDRRGRTPPAHDILPDHRRRELMHHDPLSMFLIDGNPLLWLYTANMLLR